MRSGQPKTIVRALALALMLSTAATAHAAVFTVNSNADGPAGACTAGAGGCTLREAIEAANTNANPGLLDTINFAASVTGVIQLTEGELVISEDLEIVGPGAGTLSVSAGSPDPGDLCQRAFLIRRVVSTDPDFDTTISGLTITGGDVRDGCDSNVDDDGGGGIYHTDNEGILRIVSCHIVDNKADGTNDGGGGVLSEDAFAVTISGPDCVVRGNSANDSGDGGGGLNLDTCNHGSVIDDCLIEDNHADGANDGGGGVYNDCTMTIKNSIVRGNTADEIPSNGGGGGIHDGQGPLHVIDTEISGNTANVTSGDNPFEAGGGGFYSDQGPNTFDRVAIHGNQSNGTSGGGGIFVQSAGLVVLNNTTVSDNEALDAEDGGGGVFNSESEMLLFNTTITNNRTTARDPGDPLSGAGGGLRENSSGETTVSNSIIAGNFAGGADDEETSDCFTEDGDFVTLGYNIFGTNTGCRKFGQACGTDDDCIDFRDCDGEESCVDGACAAGPDLCPDTAAPSCRESDDSCFFCTLDSECDGDGPCNTSTGECGCAFNGQCDDGNDFNGDEQCVAGVCEPGAAPCPADEVFDVELDECFPATRADKMTDDVSTVLGPLGNNGGPTQTHALLPGSTAIDCGDPEGCNPFIDLGNDEWLQEQGDVAFADGTYSGTVRYQVFWEDETFRYEYVVENDPTSSSSIEEVEILFDAACTIDDTGDSGSAPDIDPDAAVIGADRVSWTFSTPIPPNGRSRRLYIEALCAPDGSTVRIDGGSGFDAEPAVPGPRLLEFENVVDQRGEPRPVDGDDDATATCDIGAYEYQPIVNAGFTFSVPRTHFGVFDSVPTILHRTFVYDLTIGPPAGVTQRPLFDPLVQDHPSVNGIDLFDGNLFFTIDRTTWHVAHTGGVIKVMGNGIYEVGPDGTITEAFNPYDYGINMWNIDAFDMLTRTSFLFSVDRVQHVRVAGVFTPLYPWKIYLFNAAPLTIVEWFDPPGMPNIDAFDLLADGTVVLSSKENAFTIVDGKLFTYYDEDLYQCDPNDCKPTKYFDGYDQHIEDIDALAVDQNDPRLP